MRVIAFLLVTLTCSAACTSRTPPVDPSLATSAAHDAHDSHDGHGAAPHGDHTPRHGGVVYMNGDLHFEVVLSPSGAHRLYFSDAARAALPASTASEVSLTIVRSSQSHEVLAAEVDDAGESWQAVGRPLAAKDVTARVAFVVDGEPYWIDVPYVETAEARRDGE